MTTKMSNLILFTTSSMLLAFIQCETIHFTNSPAHLMGSTNITSYKLLVKDSTPITIIEANKEMPDHSSINRNYHANERIDINVDNSADSPFNNDRHVKLVTNLCGSHQLQMKNTQDIHGSIGITITDDSNNNRPTSSGHSNEYKIKSDNNPDDGNQSVKKLVYSPVLLKKFIKEYNDKLKNADIGTKNAIQQIHDQIYDQQSTNGDKDIDLTELNKKIDEIEQKYSYNNRFHNSHKHDNYDDDRRPSDQYKDQDGWVTLDAVPWSSSTVSKWYPHDEESTRRKPFPSSIRPYKGSNKFPYQDDTDDDDYYNRPKPMYDARPNVYSSWSKPQSYHSNGRPRPQPYTFTESGVFSQKYFNRDRFHSNDRVSQYPGDIITDERPSNFPSESHGHSHYYDDDHYNGASSNIQMAIAGNSWHSTVKPSTYSNERPHTSNNDHEGNGDWVLISTTKGYQIPGNRRHYGRRTMTLPTKSSVTFNVKPQSMRMHKAIKLTVLPAYDNAKNGTFSTDKNNKRPTTTTIHNGMIEIDGTHDNIDDDVRATMQTIKKKPIKTNTVKPTSNQTLNQTKRHKLLKGNTKLEPKSE